jgi:chemotaxis methyl-accepting protein methylase
VTFFISSSLALLMRQSALPPNVRFEWVDLEEESMNLEPATFDIVYSRQVLVHVGPIHVLPMSALLTNSSAAAFEC